MWTRIRRVLPGALTVAYGFAAGSCGRRAGADSAAPLKACNAEAYPGIVVDVRDSITQAPLHSATLRIFSEGHIVDTAQSLGIPGAQTSLAGVYERPGTYDIAVERSGYSPWRRDNIRVLRGECHVVPVRLLAYLGALR